MSLRPATIESVGEGLDPPFDRYANQEREGQDPPLQMTE